MTGSHYERELVRALGSASLDNRTRRVAMRAPGSGSATTRDLPDILAGIRIGVAGPSPEYLSNPWAIELKVTKGTTAYADGEEIEALQEFGKRFGAKPLLGAKFKHQGGSRNPYYLVEPADCRQTDGGNYGVPESDASDRAHAVVYPETDTKAASVEVGG